MIHKVVTYVLVIILIPLITGIKIHIHNCAEDTVYINSFSVNKTSESDCTCCGTSDTCETDCQLPEDLVHLENPCNCCVSEIVIFKIETDYIRSSRIPIIENAPLFTFFIPISDYYTIASYQKLPHILPIRYLLPASVLNTKQSYLQVFLI